MTRLLHYHGWGVTKLGVRPKTRGVVLTRVQRHPPCTGARAHRSCETNDKDHTRVINAGMLSVRN